ncbi:hypothetical protein Tco_1079045 [Tanacetum coccineum]|uniref:Uncharacterized protein n=1 Tax=Tanacetum coccineum TaxID=301880 RepID=A0ABQ5HR68_9ASTR
MGRSGQYVVPTGRVIATDSVIVATSGYVVPAAYDISPGLRPTSGIRAWRESLLKNTYCYCFYIGTMTSPYPTPPFTGPSPSDSSFTIPTTSEPVFSMATTEPVFQAQTSSSAQPSQNPQPQYQQYNSTTVSSSNAKFPYLKKEEYETWAMKMEYWIMNTDHNLWNIVLQGNSRKRTGRDPRGNIMILPPVTMEEQIAVQREIKARTILLQSLPEDHMADFHHLDDAKDIWLAVKARFGGNEESKKMRKSMLKQEFADFKITESEGLHKGYDRFQKVLSQLNQMQARPDNEDCNMKFLRALPPSWSQGFQLLPTHSASLVLLALIPMVNCRLQSATFLLLINTSQLRLASVDVLRNVLENDPPLYMWDYTIIPTCDAADDGVSVAADVVR